MSRINKIFLSVLCLSLVVSGQTLFVSPEGGQKVFAGQSVTTLRLPEAIAKAQPGTVLQLLPGVYYDSVDINISGASDLPVVIRGIAGQVGQVIFDGKTNPPQECQPLMKIVEQQWLEIENITFRNCWLYTIRIFDSSYITIRGCHFTGAKRAIYAVGNKTHHLLVENNTWIQDPSGKMWKEIPWEESHHGEYGYFNGALLASKKILGSVVFRYNTIRHAYNGIRLVGDEENLESDNFNVEIYHNTFEYIRDNPIEPERSANNWWMHHNKLYNCYAPFSFTGVAGGDWYVFGNINWFDEGPGDRGGHARGKILKFANEGPYPSKKIWVFHNSWYSRSPLITGGISRNLFYFNNAILYSQPVAMMEEAEFHESYVFDYNISSLPYPEIILDKHEKHSSVADPKFTNPQQGNFALLSQSPAKDAGKLLQIGDWKSRFVGKAPDIGAFEGDQWFIGPSFVFDSTQYQECPRIVQYQQIEGVLYIYFSVAIKQKTTQLTILYNGKKHQISATIEGRKMVCKWDSDISSTTQVLLPRNLQGDNNLPITLWSSPPLFTRYRN